ncbi:unnamed protein product, partial [Mesorhabditis spiculigera]
MMGNYETAVAQVAAEVMLFHDAQKTWISAPGVPTNQPSCVQILQHNQQQTFRIIATRQEDGSLIMNCRIHPRFKYHAARPNFHQWRDDLKQVYGLCFASDQDAQAFQQRMDWSISVLQQLQQQMTNGEYHCP